MKVGIIYCTTNLINGKKYIGQTIKSDPNYLGSGQYIKRAIEKYGKSNFIREILEENVLIEHLNESEIYWIEYFSADKSDLFYNIAPGGEGNRNLGKLSRGKTKSLDHKRKIGLAQIGHKMSDKTKQAIKLSLTGKRRTKKSIEKQMRNRPKRKPLSPESAASKRAYCAGGLSPNAKAIVQIDLIENRILKEFDSVMDACKAVGLKSRSHIIGVCRGHKKSCKGFGWRYAV